MRVEQSRLSSQEASSATATSSPTTSKSGGNIFKTLNNRIKNGKIRLNDAINELFYRYAKFAYDRTLALIIIPVVITIGLTYIVLNRQPVVSAEDLYARPDSQAQSDRVAFISAFGEKPPRRSFFLVVREDGGNILEPRILQSLRELDTSIRQDWVGSDGSRWQDVCVKDGFGDCVVQSVLEMFNSDVDLSQPQGQISFPLHTSMRDNKIRSYRTDLLVAKSTLSNDNRVESAQGLTFRYLGSGDDEKLDMVLEWEHHLLARVQATTIPDCDLTVQAKRSLDNELAASTTLGLPDYLRFGAAGIVLAVYAMIVSFSTDRRQSKTLPALAGVLAAFLGYVSGAAISYCFVHHVAPSETSPFLVLGIGVDDMFVILNSYGLAFGIKDPKERVAVAMRDCGLAITVTTLTNIIAFGIGALSPYAAISNFCITTLSGLFMGYLSCMTVFVAYLSIDARREYRTIKEGDTGSSWFCRKRGSALPEVTESDLEIQQRPPTPKSPVSTFELVASQLEKQENRLALLSVAPATDAPRSLWQRLTTPGIIEASPDSCRPGLDLAAVKQKRENASVESLGVRTVCEDGEFEPEGNVGEAWRWVFKRYIGRAIVTPLGKIIILIAFVGYLGSAIWATSNLPKGLDLVELTPYESYLRAFFDTAPRFFGGYGDEVDLFYNSPDAAWWERETAERFVEWSDKVSNASYCSGGVADGMAMFYKMSYLPALQEGLLESEDVFLSALKIFLQDPRFQQFATDFKFEGIGDAHHLSAFKTRFFTPYPHTSADLAEYLTGLRADIKSDIAEGFGAHGFTWMFLFTETDLSILSETLANLGYCFVAILLVSMFLIVNTRAPAIVMAMILMIDVGLFALLWAWGMELNMLTMVCLIISIGFSVDYTTHVVHTFSHCKGKTRNHRVVETLMLMGAPIFHGAVSTQLMLFLVLTINSYIFLVFFRMLTLVLCLAIVHGLILLPVVLSFVGPIEDHAEHGEKAVNETTAPVLQLDDIDEEGRETEKRIHSQPRPTYFPSPSLQSVVNDGPLVRVGETDTATPRSPPANSEETSDDVLPAVAQTREMHTLSLPQAPDSPTCSLEKEAASSPVRAVSHLSVFQQCSPTSFLRHPRRVADDAVSV